MPIFGTLEEKIRTAGSEEPQPDPLVQKLTPAVSKPFQFLLSLFDRDTEQRQQVTQPAAQTIPSVPMVSAKKRAEAPTEQFDFQIAPPTRPPSSIEDAIEFARLAILANLAGNTEGAAMLLRESVRLKERDSEMKSEYERQQKQYDIVKNQAGTLWQEGLKISKIHPEYGKMIRTYAQTGQLQDAQSLLNSWHTTKEHVRLALEQDTKRPLTKTEKDELKLAAIVAFAPHAKNAEDFSAAVNRLFPFRFNRDEIYRFYKSAKKQSTFFNQSEDLLNRKWTPQQLQQMKSDYEKGLTGEDTPKVKAILIKNGYLQQ